MVSVHCTVRHPRSILLILGLLVLLSIGIYLVLKDDGRPSAQNEEVVRLIVVARHGEREPLMPIPGREASVPGKLTRYGWESMKFLGEQLKLDHATFVTEASRALVSYTLDSRCRESALAIAKGMSLGNFENKPLPKLEDDLKILQSEAVDLIRQFRQTFPRCVLEMADAAIEHLKNSSLNEEDLSDDLQFQIRFLIADGVDTIRMQGAELPSNLTYAMDCLSKTVPLVDERIFAGYSDVCMKSLCKPVVERLLSELESVHNGATDKVLSIYGVSDVHVQGLMLSLKPEHVPLRPLFGGHLVFEVTPNNVIISYGREPRSQREPFKILEISRVLAILHSSINYQMSV